MKTKIALITLLLFSGTTGFAMENTNPLTDSGVAKTVHCIIKHTKNLPKAIWSFAELCWEPDGYTDAQPEPYQWGLIKILFGDIKDKG